MRSRWSMHSRPARSTKLSSRNGSATIPLPSRSPRSPRALLQGALSSLLPLADERQDVAESLAVGNQGQQSHERHARTRRVLHLCSAASRARVYSGLGTSDSGVSPRITPSPRPRGFLPGAGASRFLRFEFFARSLICFRCFGTFLPRFVTATLLSGSISARTITKDERGSHDRGSQHDRAAEAYRAETQEVAGELAETDVRWRLGHGWRAAMIRRSGRPPISCSGKYTRCVRGSTETVCA